MSENVLVPGGRDVRATLDSPGADACVVACPPHPQYGGTRSNPLLGRVGDALAPDVACLRFDYGEWDDGRGERADCRNAVALARDRFDRTGLFGYSFGGAVALVVAAEDGRRDGNGSGVDADLAAVSALAPAGGVGVGDVPGALADVVPPVQVVYGTRDTTAEWEPVVERARELGMRVDDLPADHFFAGQAGKVADRVVDFLGPHLRS